MRGGQALRLALAVLVAAPLLGGLAVGALLWRLAQGPLDAPFLARQLERQFAAGEDRATLSVARATLAWEGFRAPAPVEVRLAGAELRDAAGVPIGALPEALVLFALRPLLRGVLAPAEVTLRGPELRLLRDRAGRVRLELPTPDGPPEGPPEEPREATGGDAGAILADLLRPADDRASHTALRLLRVRDGALSLRDEAAGRSWRLDGVEIEIRRLAAGGLSGDGQGLLRGEGIVVPVRLAATALPGPRSFAVRLDLPLLRPPEISRLLPDGGALSLLDAPVALELSAELDADATPRGVVLGLRAPEGGRVAGLPFRTLEARLHATAQRLDLQGARLALAGREATAQGVLIRDDAGWRGRLDVAAERVEAADLAVLWPEDSHAGARAAAIALWPAGRLEGLRAGLDLRADGALRDWRLEGVEVAARAAASVLSLGEGGRIAAREAVLDAAVTRREARLRRLDLLLEPARSGASPTRLALAGEARLEEGRWRGSAEASLDRVRAEDLAALWPAALGGNERSWITANVTAGEARDGRWRIGAAMPADLSALEVTALAGEARLDNATIHWLRPIPPVRGVSGEARFGLDAITLAARGGRQDRAAGEPGALELREGTIRFLEPLGAEPRAEVTLTLSGPLPEAVGVIRHPRLRLFEQRPFPVQVAGGALQGTVRLGFPLAADLQAAAVRLRAEGRVRGGRLAGALLERDLEDLDVELSAGTEGMRVAGTGTFAGTPVRLGAELDFRPGPASQVVSRETASGRFDARTLAALGFDALGFVAGPVSVEARTERRRGGAGTVALSGELREAALRFDALAWEKPAGEPARAEARLRLRGETLLAVEDIRVDAEALLLRGRALAPRAGRIERVEITEARVHAGRLAGEARAPAAPGGAWSVTLRGPVLDLRPYFARDGAAEAAGDAPPLRLDGRFERVLTGPGREVLAVSVRAGTDRAGVVREATLRGQAGAGGFEIVLAPEGAGRRVTGAAADGGALLRAMGIVSTVQGGRLALDARYADARPGAALRGVAELDDFAVRDAPALGKLLQAMTLYGLVDAARGGQGLAFSRAVVPFVLTPAELRLEEARAFSPSLGLTARGRFARQASLLDMEGTIVPAYFFNSLLGNLPLVGRLFSPEAGGGLFAATFRAQGPVDEATVTVNPLAALTPGFLRGLFGLAENRP